MTVGYWTERSARIVAAQNPGDNIKLVGKPYRAYSIVKGEEIAADGRGGKVVGTMRRNCEGWFVTIPGFVFYTIPGQGAARFGKAETTVKNFPNASAARSAIKEAFQALKEGSYAA